VGTDLSELLFVCRRSVASFYGGNASLAPVAGMNILLMYSRPLEEGRLEVRLICSLVHWLEMTNLMLIGLTWNRGDSKFTLFTYVFPRIFGYTRSDGVLLSVRTVLGTT
jgi:hypothetical protein